MPSDLMPPLDGLVIVIAVVFAVSIVIGMLFARSRADRVRRSSAAGPEAAEPARPEGQAGAPSAAGRTTGLLSRRWEEGRRVVLGRGSKPG